MTKLIILLLLFIVVNYAEEYPGELNQYCVTIDDCRNFGYLCSVNRTCQCIKFYFPDNKREKCIGGVNQKCKYDEHCIEGAFCENQKTCKCKDDFVASLDGSACYSSSPQNYVSFITFTTMLIINIYLY